MKRFKTKQEFVNEYGGKWEGKVEWSSNMDYLFGLPFNQKPDDEYELYPILTDGEYFWWVTEEMITHTPHPYEGKSIAIDVSNQEESRMVQLKAFELGYGWRVGGKKVQSYDAKSLYLRRGSVSWDSSPVPEDEDEYDLILTYQQFMDGDVPKPAPEKFDGEWLEKAVERGVDYLSEQARMQIGREAAKYCSSVPPPTGSANILKVWQEQCDKHTTKLILGQDKPKSQQHGKQVKVQRTSSSIREGARGTGSAIQGRGSSARIGVGHLSHKACACESRDGTDAVHQSIPVQRKRRGRKRR
jgi:hypothetical protein